MNNEHDCTIDGVIFALRDDNEHGIIDETWVDHVYGDFVKPGDRVIDIGANIGAFSLWAAHKGAIVEAFEPEEENYRRLKENIARNDFSQSIFAFREAVWKKIGEIELFLNKNNIGGHTVLCEKDGGSQKVPCRTLAEIIGAGDRPVDFIKMDCEGSEYEILMATPDEVLANVKSIAMEWHYRSAAHASEVARMQEFRDKMTRTFEIEQHENKWDRELPYLWLTRKE